MSAAQMVCKRIKKKEAKQSKLIKPFLNRQQQQQKQKQQQNMQAKDI